MKYTLTFDETPITFQADENDEQTITRIISDLVTREGFVNLEAEDVKAMLDDAPQVVASEATASGENRCSDAALEALKDIDHAKAFILSMTTGPEVSLMEMAAAAEALTAKTDPEAQIIWGHIIDESLGENVRVSIIAAK